MSSSNRTSSKGGKTKTDKSHKTDKTDTGKSSGDKYVGKENTKSDDNLKKKVQDLIEMTQRSEEEVCLALHECNNDLQQAANMLFEIVENQWSVKKKKSRQPSSKQEKQTAEETAGGDDWNNDSPATEQQKEKPRSKSSGPNRRFNNEGGGGRGGEGGRSWRGREKQENERNLDHDGRGGRRGGGGGRPGGPGGRGGGRGGRGGGRAGGGRYPPRGGNRGNSYNKPIDTWDNNNTWDNSAANTNNAVEETWDDFPGTDEWSTEEYTGSLADTKVFTPSTTGGQMEGGGPTAMGGATDVSIATPNHDGPLDAASQQLGQTLQINNSGQQQSTTALNAAQTKYLSQLTQQNSDKYGSIQTYQSSQSYDKSVSSTSQQQQQQYVSATSQQGYVSSQTYGSAAAQQPQQQTNVYGNSNYQSYGAATTDGGVSQQQQQQPMRTKTQRARVPPPSKIPASAVEMPGDLNSSIGYLDVQFGAMDFMSDAGAYDGTGVVVDTSSSNSNVQKYVNSSSATSLDNGAQSATGGVSNSGIDLGGAQTGSANSIVEGYSPKATQSSISTALTQNLPTVENIPTSEHVSGGGSVGYSRTSTGGGVTATSSNSSQQAVLDMGKQQTDGGGGGHSYNSQSSNYATYQSKNSYNSTYNAAQTTASSYQPTNSYVNSQTGSTYGAAAGAAAYQNSYSSAASAYQTNAAAFPSITQANNSYAAANQSYAQQQNASQSVYGAGAGLNNSSTYASSASAQYNNYSSNKLKDAVYDATSGVSAQVQQANNANSASATLSLSQSTVSAGKTTTSTLAAKNSNNVVSNMPPGVAAPVMSTPYNMVQVPYFQQPLYSYEDMQLLQQRLPHMTTPFYDMSYQTPTTLAAVRDAAALGANVGYSTMSDARFTRADNNASPVPSTLTGGQQQTSTQGGHQGQPILAAGTAPPYFFATHFNTIPNYPFYQLPAATNAHGTNSSSQYPKPGAYGSAASYGGYDALGQTTAQDYGKGAAYVTNAAAVAAAQAQKAAGGGASSGGGSAANDLTAMYGGKSHGGLGKVNSYDKQGFGTGTPPPPSSSTSSATSFGAAAAAPPAAQVYITAAMAAHHASQLMHQPLHQDSGNSGGQRSQSSNQAKTSGKQYPGSYWNQS